MDSSKYLQFLLLRRLHADAETIDPRLIKCCEFFRSDSARIHLHSDLRIRCQSKSFPDMFHQLSYAVAG